MNVGLFCGSFNPIHVGHLALANYLCEYEGLDEVWFVVSPRNPFKLHDELMDDAFRLRLVRLAIAGYPRFVASDFEFHLPRPSYTIHTLDGLRALYPEHVFHLIIGSDNWPQFPHWRAAERILSEYHVIIYPRPGYPVGTEPFPPHVRLARSPLFEISATFVRDALKQGKDVRYFLHPEVYKVLTEEGGYFLK